MSTSTAQRRFRYLSDPICVISLALYCLNRWLLKPNQWGGWFCHDYLNDVLCLPLFLPVILRLQSFLRIRRHDEPPTLMEVLHNWIIFTVVFELIVPRLPWFRSAADPWDAVAYLAGGLVGYGLWRWSCS